MNLSPASGLLHQQNTFDKTLPYCCCFCTAAAELLVMSVLRDSLGWFFIIIISWKRNEIKRLWSGFYFLFFLTASVFYSSQQISRLKLGHCTSRVQLHLSLQLYTRTCTIRVYKIFACCAVASSCTYYTMMLYAIIKCSSTTVVVVIHSHLPTTKYNKKIRTVRGGFIPLSSTIGGFCRCWSKL